MAPLPPVQQDCRSSRVVDRSSLERAIWRAVAAQAQICDLALSTLSRTESRGVRPGRIDEEVNVSATFEREGSGSGSGPRTPDGQAFLDMQASPEFQELRSRLRRFVFPMAGLFLAWYLLYVLLADYAHGFMATKVLGNINVGLVLGLLQFVSTFVITGLYVRFANRDIDPRAEAIREQLEGSVR